MPLGLKENSFKCGRFDLLELLVAIKKLRGVTKEMESLNFSFIEKSEPLLFRLATLSEQLFPTDPNTSLLKSRQFGEAIAQQIAARSRRQSILNERQVDLLNRLKADGLIPKPIADMLHFIRKKGNEANHDLTGSASDALASLRFVHSIAIWYTKAYYSAENVGSSAFIPPRAPHDTTPALKIQIEELNALLSTADRERAAHAARLEQTESERQRLAALALERDTERAVLQEEIARLRAESQTANAPSETQLAQFAEKAFEQVKLSEADTRDLIDSALQDAGWEADHRTLRQSVGTAPELGRNIAIAEWKTSSGPVDYALFCGVTCVGVIEAKRESKDVPGVLQQAERYARDIILPAGSTVQNAPFSGAPTNDIDDFEASFKTPFAFATNGRPHVKQMRTKSGIWFRDLRSANNHAKDLSDWFSPQDLLSKLEQVAVNPTRQLAEEPFDYANLRTYQQDAITAIERAIESGAETALISMATGTGKTRMAIALMYRALKRKRFRRILFLVDRNALADQTLDSLENAELENLLKFTQTYGVAGPADKDIGKETRVHVATIQAMVKRVMLGGEDRPTPGTYDLIIVDEAHRGYALDAELRDEDIEFRSTEDYLSKYRRVLDYFDAVKVGLTATPALQTTEIFGPPVYRYSYRQAVIDGHLIDHLPPKRIVTALNQAGIEFKGGEEVSIVDPETGEIDTATLPDDTGFEVQEFNKRVYTPEFNRVVAETIAQEIPPDRPGKTLIFAVRDEHADTLVTELKVALQAEYGDLPDDTVMKITGQTDRPLDQIRRFRSDARPQYVVTVDMLTTGVDIPKICNLVFVRRVNSRILYDQMIGRATRLCPDIGKTEFRIFDAVDLYDNLQSMTDMRPVVTNPNLSFAQLTSDLANAPGEESRRIVQEQIVAKLRRRLPRLTNAQAEVIEAIIGESAEDLADMLQAMAPDACRDFLANHPRLVTTLDEPPAKGRRPGMPIYEGDDELIAIEDIFKDGLTPEDYIEAFERYIRENMNAAAGMVAATQRPRELTRQSLKELALGLDEQGYSETHLRRAYGRVRNADIAAHIIGFVRQAALGDPLVPYATRVDNAIRQLIEARNFTNDQKQWLRRIGRALKEYPVADQETLNAPAFQQFGGWNRGNQAFEGQLANVLADINEAVWSRQSG